MSRFSGRGLRQTATTLLLAALLVWWAMRGLDWPTLRAALAVFDLGRLVVVMVCYVAVYYLLDVAGFVLTYRRHLAPQVPIRHVATVVCGKQLVGAVLPVLTKTVAPVYFRRRWGISPLRTLGASELVGFADGAAVSTAAAAAILLGSVPLPAGYTWALLGWWAITAAMLVWAWWPVTSQTVPAGRWWQRMRHSQLLAPLASSTPGELATQVTIRVLNLIASAGVLAVLLLDLGVHLDLGQLALFAPLFLFSAMLPVSVGGFGGPQAIAALLLVEVWQLTDRPAAAAFSVLWSSAFLLGRLALSTPFAVPLARLLRDEGGTTQRPAGGARGQGTTAAPGTQ